MKYLFSLILSMTFLQAGGNPVNIPIQNPSFTEGTTGWKCTAGSSVIQFNGAPMLDLGYGANCQQTIRVLQMPVGVYTLSFSVENFFYWYPGEYTASISLSGAYESPWCSTSFHPLGDSMQVSVACPVRDMYAQDLTIAIYDKGWQSLATNFALKFTPVP